MPRTKPTYFSDLVAEEFVQGLDNFGNFSLETSKIISHMTLLDSLDIEHPIRAFLIVSMFYSFYAVR
jgi:hypothetical protein